MDTKRLGRCYELAGRYQMSNGGILVHGSIEGFGNPRLDHAWVVNDDGTIYEPTLDQTWEAFVFEQFFNSKEHKRYDRVMSATLSLKSEHWGPW